MTERVVTVDGPAGSGKTTLGRRLATALDLPLVDTGLFYRGLMVAAVRDGVGGDEIERLSALAASSHIEINTSAAPGWQCRVDGVDAGPILRDPANAILVSMVSRIPEVREHLLAAQRDLAADGAVAVGRDCGTVVFPDAPVKFYLEAPTAVRAGRRAEQLGVDAATLAGEVAGRDTLDSTRTVAPLRPAADAHVIDTGTVGIEQMVADALEICAKRGIR